jgi:hypothetical protein
VEGRQELLFDQDFIKVTMGNNERRWPFHDMFQWLQNLFAWLQNLFAWLRNLFSSDSKEFVALPSCSNMDVGDPNLFLNTIQSTRLLHISFKLF